MTAADRHWLQIFDRQIHNIRSPGQMAFPRLRSLEDVDLVSQCEDLEVRSARERIDSSKIRKSDKSTVGSSIMATSSDFSEGTTVSD